MAREVGFKSVGHDLINGLPFQTVEHVIETIEKTIKLKPDRIAFYSYAHVPWIKAMVNAALRMRIFLVLNLNANNTRLENIY